MTLSRWFQCRSLSRRTHASRVASAELWPTPTTNSATSPITRQPLPRFCGPRATPRSASARGTWHRWSSAPPPVRSTSGPWPGLRPVLPLPRRGDRPVQPRTCVRHHPIEPPARPEDGHHISEEVFQWHLRAARSGGRADRRHRRSAQPHELSDAHPDAPPTNTLQAEMPSMNPPTTARNHR